MRLFDPGPEVVEQAEEPKAPHPLDICLDLLTYPDEVCAPEWRHGLVSLRRCRRCGFPA